MTLEHKKISFLQGAALVIGLTVGAGLWATPVIAAHMAGSTVVLLSLLVLIPLLLLYPVYLTLVKVWPVSAAHYRYTSRLLLPENSFAGQYLGFIIVFVMLCINVLVSFQLMSVAAAQFLHSLAPSVPFVALLIGLILFPLLLVRFGIRIVGWAELVLSTALLLSLVAIIAVGFLNVDVGNLASETEMQVVPVGAAFILVFATVTPALYIFDVGGEVKNAVDNLGRIFLIGALTNVVTVTLLAIVIVGVAGGTDLADATLHHIAGRMGAETLVLITGVGAFIAGVTTSIGVATVLTRWAHVLAEEGIFPKPLAKTNKYGEPGHLILLMAIIAVAVVFADLTVANLAGAATVAGVLLVLPITLIGIRLPTTFPEVFEHEAIKDSAVLRPKVVRWTSLLAFILMACLGIVLLVQEPLGGIMLVGTSLVGTALYAFRFWQEGETLHKDAIPAPIQTDD